MTAPSSTIAFKTPAKVNLGLYILGKREDGFHELETLFQMVNWCDEIKIECLGDGLDLICNQPDIPNDDGNLVIKAARLLQTRFPDRCKGARIHLKKKYSPWGRIRRGQWQCRRNFVGAQLLMGLEIKAGRSEFDGFRTGFRCAFFPVFPLCHR